MEVVAQLEVEPRHEVRGAARGGAGHPHADAGCPGVPPLPKHDHVDGGARTPNRVIGSIYKYGHCRDKQNVTRLEIKEKQQPYVI